jgi:hypothetical protein
MPRCWRLSGLSIELRSPCFIRCYVELFFIVNLVFYGSFVLGGSPETMLQETLQPGPAQDQHE